MGSTASSQGSSFKLWMPGDQARNYVCLSDQIRLLGLHLLAGKGTGKSRLMGRVIAWLDFLRGIPVVLLDPVGASIDNFLDRLMLLPKRYQEKLWPRVLYVDMAGRSGNVVPFPLYYRLGDESLYEISQRYLDTIKALDPHLMSASVEGFNALWNIGTYTGMVLTALPGYQITEAEHLIRNIKTAVWSERLDRAVENNPEARPAVDFFRQQFIQWPSPARRRHTNSFLRKIALFTLDSTMKAMFGAAEPGIDWEVVVRKGCAVLLDFEGVTDTARRNFLMLWVFHYFLEFVRHRGHGRHTPISFIVDELSLLLGFETLAADPFVDLLDEFLNVLARNYLIWPTISHQGLWQAEQTRLQKTLMSMGTQIIGATSDPETARLLAQYLFRYDPHLVRKEEPVWMSLQGFPFVVDHTTVEYTAEQQEILASYIVREQKRFQFLLRPPNTVSSSRRLLRVSIENLDRGIYPDAQLVEKARDILSRRRGRPVQKVLGEIEERLAKKQLPAQRPRMPAGNGQ